MMDIVSYGLKTPALKNTFNKDNALVTMYYVIMLLIICAIGEDRDDSEILAFVQEYEKIMLAVASMSSKLLVNNDVYEFIMDTTQSCLSRFWC